VRQLVTPLAAVIVALVLTTSISAADGDLDPSFGNGGKVVTDLGANEIAFGIAPQSDGKIVVVGGAR
jgi:hypothetical protein